MAPRRYLSLPTVYSGRLFGFDSLVCRSSLSADEMHYVVTRCYYEDRLQYNINVTSVSSWVDVELQTRQRPTADYYRWTPVLLSALTVLYLIPKLVWTVSRLFSNQTRVTLSQV